MIVAFSCAISYKDDKCLVIVMISNDNSDDDKGDSYVSVKVLIVRVMVKKCCY